MARRISRRDVLVWSGAAVLAAPGVVRAAAAQAAKALAAGGASTPAHLLVRPYLQPGPTAGAGPDSKLLIWMTDPTGGDFTVEYGWAGASPKVAAVQRTDIRIKAPTPEQLKKKPTTAPADPDDIGLPAGKDAQPQHYIKYTAALNDLPRGTAVWYRVRAGQTTIYEQTFRSRAAADQPIRFVGVGDLANGKPGQNAIAYQASLSKPDFMLALGDLVYPIGRVSQYMDHFWRTYANVDAPGPAAGAALMGSVPFYALLGNHDVDTALHVFPDCLGAFYFFHAPANGPGEGKWSTPLGKDKEVAENFRKTVGASYASLGYYSFDEGPVHFTVLDSNGYIKVDDPALLKWIETDITASKAKWKVVLQHAPMFHTSPMHYVEQKTRRLSPLLEKCGVDVVLTGHVHNYQRSRPLRFDPAPPKPRDRLVHGTFTIDNEFDGVTRTKPKGIIHIVSGGGGGTLYKDPVDKIAATMKEKYAENWAPFTAKQVTDRHSFVVGEATSKQLLFRALDHEGKEFDRVVITKE